MAKKFESKYTVLVKKINNVVYELLVKTHADMVYVDDKKTLTERLIEITNLFTTTGKELDKIREMYEDIMGDESGFSSFKEVWDYLNIHGDPKSELIKLIESKQDSEEGKGLSTNDFTDIMYEKLKNDYTRKELEEMFEIIETKTNDLKEKTDDLEEKVTELEEKQNNEVAVSSEHVKDGDVWFQIIRIDE